ncbi:helix-turn-helix domain-containing protein [Microvirga sp. W0021]|uniref:Helix-turn-helix domain-containing protein n=1 Tax=Hohaiivirga grylli TaxID=3133970 RepID=A0ABV0BKI2_9HYPH
MVSVKWSFIAPETKDHVILPDGCVDIIIVTDNNGCENIILTNWDVSPRQICIEQGESFRGYRCKPGVLFNDIDYQELSQNINYVDEVVASGLKRNTEIEDIVAELSDARTSIKQVAKRAWVSPRTLQRWFSDKELLRPEFWKLLGRARQAASALPSYPVLADFALDYGFSDQSHMTREFVRWFGMPPSQLRRNKDQLNLLAQPGLGNWIGEHSSIR